jgi:Flp pilus assembly protein TadD
VITVISQSSVGSIADLNLIPLSYRLMNACHSLIFYLVKMAVPTGLTALYPIDLKKTYSPPYVYSVMACVLIVLACFIYRRKRPYLAVAGIYYLASLAPVLGFVQSGSQSAADRFTYLPSLAPSLLLGAAVAALLSRWRAAFLAFAGILAVLLGLGTLHQTATWKDNIILWENVLSVNPRNSPCAHANLADGLINRGRLDDALLEFNRAIVIGPTGSFSHDGKGFTLLQQGRLEEAVQEMQTAIRLEPKNAEFLCHLGMAYARMGKTLDALQKYQESLQVDPYWAETYQQMGIFYMDQRELEKAREALQKAVALDPDNCFYWMGLNAVLQKMGSN